MKNNQTNKQLIITGGSGAIGRVLVKHFHHNKYDVLFTTRNATEVTETINAIKDSANNSRLEGIALDLLASDSTKTLISYLDKHNINPNALIQCARSLQFLKVNKQGIPSKENWLNEYHLDVVIPYFLSMELANKENSNLESIVNIGSIYGIVAPNPVIYNNPLTDSPIHYSIAKAGVIHLSKELAVRLSAKNIRVNTVSYGGLKETAPAYLQKNYAAQCPQKKMLDQEDIASPVELLVADGSKGITGQNIVVDGGWTIW